MLSVALLVCGVVVTVRSQAIAPPETTTCTISTMEALRIKETAKGRVSGPAMNVSLSGLTAHNWYQQLAGAVDADARFVYDTLAAAGTRPPTYRIGFLFWGVDVMASSKMWADAGRSSLGEDTGFPWVTIPCMSACDGDVIAGPAYFADQADMALDLVRQYTDGIPETLAGLVSNVMAMTRVAVITGAVDAARLADREVVMPDVMSQRVAASHWGFRWFANDTRRNMYTCRRLITTKLQ